MRMAAELSIHQEPVPPKMLGDVVLAESIAPEKTRGQEVAEWLFVINRDRHATYFCLGGVPGAHFRLNPPDCYEEAFHAARETVAAIIDSEIAMALAEEREACAKIRERGK